MIQRNGGILRWKKRNRKCTWVDGGEEGRDLKLSKCRDHHVTKCPVARMGSGVRPGGRAEAGQKCYLEMDC